MEWIIAILLTVIAVGVLLASESGKKLLRWLIIIVLILGGGYLLFWIVMLAIAFFSDQETRDVALSILGGTALLSYLVYGVYTVVGKIRRKEITVVTVKKYIRKVAKDIWMESKIATVFLGLSVLFIIYVAIFGL